MQNSSDAEAPPLFDEDCSKMGGAGAGEIEERNDADDLDSDSDDDEGQGQVSLLEGHV